MAGGAQRRGGAWKWAARLFQLGCAASGFFARPGSAQEPCRPSVSLEGGIELVGPIAQVLRQRGIGEKVDPGCPLVRAAVERRGAEVLVRVVEENRRSERLAADTTAAATFIESWARTDISAPLLAAPAFSSDPVPVPAALPPAPVPSLPGAPRYSLGASAEAAVDVRGAAWLGAALHGCGRAGPLCIGALWRVTSDLPEVNGDGLRTHRLSTELLLTIDLPLRLRRFVLAPGIGLGVGWLHLDGSGTSPEDNSGSGSAQPARPFTVAANDGGMRAELRLLFAAPVSRRLEVVLGLLLDAAFLGSDPIAVTLPTDKVGEFELVNLPGMPWGALRGVIALRVGG